MGWDENADGWAACLRRLVAKTYQLFGLQDRVYAMQAEADRGIPPMPVLGDRSPRWPHARDEFLKTHPACQACGKKDALDVHHVRPFHVHPELELDPENLMALCRPCHFVLAHLGSWRKWNKLIRRDAREHLSRVEDFRDDEPAEADGGRL